MAHVATGLNILVMDESKMYIKKLHVCNIGPFKQLDVHFSPEINIIVGANASGKTSILKCICYCFDHHNMQLIRFRKGAEYWCDVHSAKSFRVGARDIVDDDMGYQQINVERWPQVPGDGVEVVYLPFDNHPHNIFAIGANRSFEYRKLSGMQREAKGEERRKNYKQNNTSFLTSSNLPDIKQWLINRYFSIEKAWAKVEASNWQSVMSQLPTISPTNAIIEFSRIERDLEPLFLVNGIECYLEELSSGFKSVLSIIFSIIDWGEGVYDGEQALVENLTGTILIDEVDTHLHPEWQVKIMSSLGTLFPKLQFIVTSHSPLVIANAEAHQVIKIPALSDKLVLKPDDKNYKGWQIEYILEDLMGCIKLNELSSSDLLKAIDRAYEEKDIDKFDRELIKLTEILSGKDPIIQFYEIKRSNLYLSLK